MPLDFIDAYPPGARIGLDVEQALTLRHRLLERRAAAQRVTATTTYICPICQTTEPAKVGGELVERCRACDRRMFPAGVYAARLGHMLGWVNAMLPPAAKG